MTQEDIERYFAAQHAMQCGVKVLMNLPCSDLSAASLRIGINTALCDSASLARLLIQKGLITKDEYEKAIADGMEQEVERYKKNFKEYTGLDVELV